MTLLTAMLVWTAAARLMGARRSVAGRRPQW